MNRNRSILRCRSSSAQPQCRQVPWRRQRRQRYVEDDLLWLAVAQSPAGYLQDQPKGSSGFWQIEYYQPYFDVDTKTVSGILHLVVSGSFCYFLGYQAMLLNAHTLQFCLLYTAQPLA